MANRKLGVTSTSLHMPFDQMLPIASRMGITGVQLWNVGGEHDARSLSKAASIPSKAFSWAAN